MEIRSEEVRIAAAPTKQDALGAPAVVANSSGILIASDVALHLKSPLSIPGTPDVLLKARDIRRSTPVLDEAIDDTFLVAPMPLTKFLPNQVLPVRLGGTGLSNLGENQLIVGSGQQPLKTVPEVLILDDGAIAIAGGIRIPEYDLHGAPTGLSVKLTSTVDDWNRPALILEKSDGQKVDVLSPYQSLAPLITLVTRTSSDATSLSSAVTYKAHRPKLITAAAWEAGNKTAYEVAEAYRAAAHAQIQLADPHDHVAGQGYPSLETYTQSNVTLQLPPLFNGIVAYVVTDQWGNVSPPYEITI